MGAYARISERKAPTVATGLESYIHAGRFSAFSRFTKAPLLCGQQSSSNAVDVRQTEQGVHLRQILLDAPVAHLRVAPQPLHYQIRMLSNGPYPREAPVACLLPIGQRLVPLATLTDLELKPALFGERLELLGVVGRVPVQLVLRSVQQFPQYRRVVN